MQCSVLLYSLLYKYCCTAVWRPPHPQCSYCSRHRLSGRRSYLHPQFTAQLVGACSYWHLETEHVFLWPCAYYYYFLRLKFLTTKFLTGDAVCISGFSGFRRRHLGSPWVGPINAALESLKLHPRCNLSLVLPLPPPSLPVSVFDHLFLSPVRHLCTTLYHSNTAMTTLRASLPFSGSWEIMNARIKNRNTPRANLAILLIPTSPKASLFSKYCIDATGSHVRHRSLPVYVRVNPFFVRQYTVPSSAVVHEKRNASLSGMDVLVYE